nr:PadR family transcriptional regulator [uncultured Mediterraneibacter sp.]
MIFTPNAPVMDFLVLSVIAEGDAYGYQISQIIKRVVNSKDSTLYPILKRLQESGYVDTYDEQYQGRNRKYYRITDKGREAHAEMLREWEQYKFIIDDIVKGGNCNDEK